MLSIDDAPLQNPMGDFETCVRPLRREMVLLARRLTRSQAAADDVVQEAMLRAWKAWSRWTPSLSADREVTSESAQQCLRQWLIRITCNTFGNHYRSHTVEMRTYGDKAPAGAITDAWVNAHGEAPPSPASCTDGFGDEVTEALDSILPDRRDLMLLAATDMKPIEISEVTGIPYGTVNSRMFRARADLGERLAEYAAREYGIGPLAPSGRARVYVANCESGQVEQTDPQTVDDIMVDIDDAAALLDR